MCQSPNLQTKSSLHFPVTRNTPKPPTNPPLLAPQQDQVALGEMLALVATWNPRRLVMWACQASAGYDSLMKIAEKEAADLALHGTPADAEAANACNHRYAVATACRLPCS